MNGQSVSELLGSGHIAESEGMTGINQARPLSLNQHEHVRPSVAPLFLHGGPAAIVRRIGTIVVDAIKRMGGARLASHVGQEICEVGAPALADGNAAPAVLVPIFVLRIRRAIEHAAPSMIFRCHAPAGGVAVRRLKWSEIFPIAFNLEAATALRVATGQLGSIDNRRRAAVACARPSWLAFIIIVQGPRYDHESSKTLTGAINECRHIGVLFLTGPFLSRQKGATPCLF